MQLPLRGGPRFSTHRGAESPRYQGVVMGEVSSASGLDGDNGAVCFRDSRAWRAAQPYVASRWTVFGALGGIVVGVVLTIVYPNGGPESAAVFAGIGLIAGIMLTPGIRYAWELAPHPLRVLRSELTRHVETLGEVRKRIDALESAWSPEQHHRHVLEDLGKSLLAGLKVIENYELHNDAKSGGSETRPILA